MPIKNDEDIEMISVDQNPFTLSNQLVSSQTIPVKVHYVNIDGEIKDPSCYRDFFNLLDFASENDTIIIRLNTMGGDISTTIQIVNGLNKTRARTVCELYQAYSAGSIIALCCSEVLIMQFSSMMIHNIITGMSGKISDMKSYVDFSHKYYGHSFMKVIYEGFLSQEEISQVLKGEELWFGQSDIEKRLKQRQDKLSKEEKVCKEKKRGTASKQK
jgi:ATP-dependent protease ClpP protease subunit